MKLFIKFISTISFNIILISFGFAGHLSSNNKHLNNKTNSDIKALSVFCSANGNSFQYITKSSFSSSYYSGESKAHYRGSTSFLPMIGFSLVFPSKKEWSFKKLSIIYMPENAKEYNQVKYDMKDIEDIGWQKISDSYEIKFHFFQFTFTHLYRIKLFTSKIRLLLGLGLGGGILITSGKDNNYTHMAGYGYPLGGIDIYLIRRISIFSEFHYQFGLTTSQSESSDYGSSKWHYKLFGPVLMSGLNFWF